MLPPPPRELPADAAAKLRDAFARAFFSRRVYAVLGGVGPPGWKARMRAALQNLPTPACAVLAKFFIIGDGVERGQLAGAVGGSDVLWALERAGLAAVGWDGMCAFPYQLSLAGDVPALSDPISDPPSLSPPDEYILPVSQSSQIVDCLTVRVPCELAVDLGCGQGYLGLRALTHASRCIATDINARALEFARANASLHGQTGRFEFRIGSFFEPLADVQGRIDLFTCNPPFIVQPGGHVTAVAASMEGDAMLEHLVRHAPRVLREGGWATVIGLWEHAEPGEWVSRVAGWVRGAGCDTLALKFRTFAPDEYLTYWFPPDLRAGLEEGWRELCRRRGIGAMTYGGVVMRKRSGENWLHSLSTLIEVRSGNASEQVLGIFESQTALRGGGDSLLESRLRAARGWRFDPTLPAPKSAPQGVSIGLALPCEGAAQMEAILQAFQSDAPARDILARLQTAGVPIPENREGLLRALVNAGCLDVVGSPAPRVQR